jgi:hypothetical protein
LGSSHKQRELVVASTADDAAVNLCDTDGSSDQDDNCDGANFLLARAKVLGACDVIEQGRVFVERGSIYGAVIVMPQLARSLDWPHILTVEAIRSYLLFMLDLALQSLILMMLAKHETILNTFSGQMFLCDMGAGCSDVYSNHGKTCTGPGGTNITPPRLYSYDSWNNRNFVKASLKTLFPDMVSEIDENIDPGEYGLESYWCRWLCCFLFMMTMVQEAINIVDMAQLLYYIPSHGQSWVHIEDNECPSKDIHSNSGNTSKQEHGEWWEKVVLMIAGMPRIWKITNIILVLLPKVMVWKLTAQTGVMFLMETAAIDDLIVNSIALTFVLAISEMVVQTLTSETTHTLLERCKDYPLYNDNEMQHMSDDDILKEYGALKHVRRAGVFDIIRSFFPLKLIATACLTMVCVFGYYRSHCNLLDGWPYSWLPKPLHLAESTRISVLNAFFPGVFRIPLQKSPEWTMPENSN